MRVSVIAPGPLGDAVMATPAIYSIWKNTNQKIYLFAKPHILELFKDEVWFFKGFNISDLSLWNLYSIFNLKPDVCFIFPNSIRSFLISLLSRAKIKIGYGDGLKAKFLRKKLPFPKKPKDMISWYSDLVRAFGIDVKEKRLRLSVSKKSEEEIGKILKNHGLKENVPILLISPGSSFGPSKCWPTSHFAKICDYLYKEFSLFPVCAPAKNEIHIVKEIKNMVNVPFLSLDSPPIPVSLLKALVKRSQLVVTNDTGTRHIASAFQIPHVVIMGATDPRYTDYGDPFCRILRLDLPCSPCHKRICPYDHSCMKNISPDMVIEKVKELFCETFRNN